MRRLRSAFSLFKPAIEDVECPSIFATNNISLLPSWANTH